MEYLYSILRFLEIYSLKNILHFNTYVKMEVKSKIFRKHCYTEAKIDKPNFYQRYLIFKGTFYKLI